MRLFQGWETIYYSLIIPNTAVFGPTKLIETIGTARMRMKISAEDLRFLNLDF